MSDLPQGSPALAFVHVLVLALAAPTLASAQGTAATFGSGSSATEDGTAARMSEVVVTGYRVPTLLREAADSVTIISREEIEQREPATGVDLFRQVPGLQIDQLGGPGGLSSVYLRGSDPNHTLVLIDGVRVNDPTNARGGGYDLSNLDPSNIERVEVLRGAASSVYGADAMGGVINIITRSGTAGPPNGEVSGGFGGHDYRSINGRVAAGTEAVRFSLGVSRLQDGRDALGGELDLDVYTGSARIALGRDARIDLHLRHSERDSSSFPEDSGGIRLAQFRTLDRKRADDTSYGIRGQWDISEAASLNAALTRYTRAENIDSPGVAPGVRNEIGVPAAVSRTDYERDNLLGNLLLHFPRGSELALGTEFQREHGVNDTVYSLFGAQIPARFDLKRDTRSGFAEFKWLAADDLVVRGGLRRDWVDGISANTSPSAGLHYALRSIGGAIKASYSEGFKPPSFFALGLPPELSGNPDLRAEHSKGASITYEQQFWKAGSRASVSLFKTRYTDLVTFDNQTNQLVNANNVDVRGLEFEVDLKVSASLSLRGHFTRLLTHVVDSDEPLRQRPGKRASFQALYAFNEGSRLSWSTEYVTEVFDSSVPTGNLMLPTTLRSDVAYAFRIRKWLKAAVAIDNVFDKRNEVYIGFTSPGRRLRVNLSASF